jgi:hypothetical protein
MEINMREGARRETHEVVNITGCAAAAGVLAAVVGGGLGLTVTQWLTLGLAASLVLWVGGAISGQFLLARMFDRNSEQETLDFVRLLMRIIPRVCAEQPAGRRLWCDDCRRERCGLAVGSGAATAGAVRGDHVDRCRHQRSRLHPVARVRLAARS